MKLTKEIIDQEMELTKSDSYQLGTLLYMGMADINGHMSCVAVGYKIDYCLKKMRQVLNASSEIKPLAINKVLTGGLEPCEKFEIENYLGE